MKYKELDVVDLVDGRNGTIVFEHNVNTFEVEIIENDVTSHVETIKIEQILKKKY